MTCDSDGARFGPSDSILTVDLAALAANWRTLADLAAPAECAGVVKADGYGLGMTPVARALTAAGCRSFFVAHPEEGAALRDLLPDAAIHVLHGLRPGAEAAYLAYRLVPLLSTERQLRAWVRHGRSLGRRLPAGLQLDTGMTRLGLDPARLAGLADDADGLQGVETVLAMSHLATADAPDDPANEAQRSAFEAATAGLPGTPRSLAASSGIFLGPRFYYDMIRPGIALYGGNPRPGRDNPMRPVVGLRARVLQVHDLAEARAVGYGGSHRAEPGSRIATVAFGYADGYIRRAGRCARAVVAGRPVPVVGRVSMDLLALDVTGVPAQDVAAGSMVELLSDIVTIDELAAAADTIPYEVLVRLGRRAERRFQGGTGDGSAT